MLAPVLLAGAVAGVYLAWAPPSADLAAQTFRSDLISAHGFAIWNNDWYAGHYLPGYSLLSPELGAWLGPRLMGALAAVGAAAAFAALARHRYGSRALVGSLWFALGTGTLLFTGRLTFGLGVAVGLGALLALQRGRLALAIVLGALTTFASPVAGLFLGLAAAAAALAGGGRGALAVAASPLVAMLALALAFPSGGVEPFAGSAFRSVPIALAILLVLLPRDERALRIGAWLYLSLCVALFVVDTPVGGNATRLGALFAGPVLALTLAGRRNLALALAAPFLLYWQWVAPVRDLSDALGDPSVHASYYAPLLAQLQARAGSAPVRVEVPPTRNRWEAAYVAPRFPLARGWLRQEESGDFDLFTNGNLTPGAYRRWLENLAVSYVAVPDARLDYLATDEVALIRSGLPYLREVWSGEHWTLYRVRRPAPLSGPHSPLVAVGLDSFTLDVPRPGTYLVRIHYSRYFTATGGACVEPYGDWTRVVAPSPGTVDVAARFSLGRLLGGSGSCSG